MLNIVPWNNLAINNIPADLVINATSLGLQKEEIIDLNFSSFDKKTIFYDVIYNPHQTSFLKKADNLGYQTINGMMMFLYQAQLAYEIWNKQKPEIDTNLLNLVRQN